MITTLSRERCAEAVALWHAAERLAGARALVAAAEGWLGARVPKVQLMVRDDNAAAVAFYERLGYARQDTTVLGRRLDTEGGVERVAPRTPDVSDGPPLTSTGAPRGSRRPRRGGR